MKRRFILLALATVIAAGAARDPRLKNAFRSPEQNGWHYVHLAGAPGEIGFQHGYLLAREIEDAQRVVSFSLQHDTSKPWTFFRQAAQDVFWPRVDDEYRAELQGMAEGLKARHVKLDLWDMVAMNGGWSFRPTHHLVGQSP